MFGKGKIQISIQKTNYIPGDIISGNVNLKLKKPVKAREVSISLIGEQIIKRSGGRTGDRGRSTTTERFYIFDFKQQLDSEKEYSQGGDYNFEIKIPSDILNAKPQTQEVEGWLGQGLKIAQTAATITGTIPMQMQRTEWYLLAKLDIPGGFDITKRTDITIG